HVARDDNPAPTECADLPGNFFQLLGGARRQHDIGTGLRQRQRARGADSSTCTRDDRGLAVDPESFEHQPGVGAPVASAIPWASVFHDRVAHLMRTGNFTTPRSASRSPSLVPSPSTAPSSGSISVSLPSPPIDV